MLEVEVSTWRFPLDVSNSRVGVSRKTVASRAGAAAMGLKAVFLDFDDTLCATSEHDVPAFEAATAAAAAALSESGGLAAGPVDRARLLADFRVMFSRTPWDPSPNPEEVGAWRASLWTRALALQVTPPGVNPAAAVAAAGEAAQAAFDGHRLAHLVFAPGAREAVAHARAQGLALVMITNGHHRVQRDKLAAVRAHELFPDPDSIIVGGEEVLRGGEEKPSREIFLKACGVAGCAPHEAAHVGDSLATDVQVRLSRFSIAEQHAPRTSFEVPFVVRRSRRIAPLTRPPGPFSTRFAQTAAGGRRRGPSRVGVGEPRGDARAAGRRAAHARDSGHSGARRRHRRAARGRRGDDAAGGRAGFFRSMSRHTAFSSSGTGTNERLDRDVPVRKKG